MIRRIRSGGSLSSGEALLWLWILVVVGFFSLARFKLDHYIFPAAPACCLIAAHAWRESACDTDGRLWGTRYSVLGIAGLLIIGGSFGGVYLSKIDLALPATALVLPLALFAGGVGLMFQAERRHWGVPVAAPVALYRLERWRGSLRYYLNRPVQRLEAIDEARAFLQQPEQVYVVMLRRDYVELRNQHIPVYLTTAHRAVVGTTGRGLRKQRWSFLVVVTNAPRRGSKRFY